MPERKQAKSSQESVGDRLGKGHVSILSRDEQTFCNTLDSEHQVHYKSLNPITREKLHSFSKEHQYDYFELDEREQDLFIQLNDVERDNFLAMDVSEREECLSGSYLQMCAYCYLEPPERVAYAGLSDGEKQILGAMLEEGLDIKQVFTLSFSEREAYLFLNRVAQHDGFHSLKSVADFIQMNRDKGGDYGTALLIMYAVIHRHHGGAEKTSEYLERAIQESHASTDSTFDLEKMILKIRGTSPAKAANFDKTLREFLYSDVEEVMKLFRKYHYDDGSMQIISTPYEDV